MAKLRGSICLTDIPECRMYQRKNGKWYVDIIIGATKEPKLDAEGKVWKDHYIKCNLKKDEQAPEGVNLYFGDLKEMKFDQQPASESGLKWLQQAEPSPQPIDEANDDLFDKIF